MLNSDSRRNRTLLSRLLLAVSFLCVSPTLLAQPYDFVIANGRVMDPESGLDAVRHIGITDGKVQALSETPLEGRETLDASGRVVAPGFIDLNTYQHGDPFFRLRAADGVTSVLYLEDGAVDVAAYYAALEGRALVHYGIAVGHGSLRSVAMGDTSFVVVDGVVESGGVAELNHRALTAAELDTLAARVQQGLREGAVAVGFGIEYTPGATHTEILRMLELAARYEAPAHLHLRDWNPTEDWGQFYEVFGGAIHTGGALHINHLQSIAGSFTEPSLALIERARSFGLSITTECYPYTAALTFIESALFDSWESWPEERFQRYEWPVTGERLTRETFARYRTQGGVVIIHPGNGATQEAAVRGCLSHPLPMIASDGAWDEGKTHPRSAGTNSRVLGHYVREEGVLSLMEAIRKMSLAPARHLEQRVPGMHNKGRIRVGADADLVVFDPATVIDRATYRESTLPPAGIEAVFVGGVPVVRAGTVQDGVFPGRPIRAPRSK
jgi:cytosine/adenosine deaminase-related metal-dependent hydrolase